MGINLTKLAKMVDGSIERNTQYIEPRFFILSAIAVVAFPLYYVVWKYVFPQPYENLTLRMAGCLMFLPFMFVRYWPQWTQRYKSIYWFVATLYGLPFFFTYMLLMNAASTVWLMSTLVAVFIMILLLSWYNLIIQFAVGSLLAWLVFSTTSGQPNLGIDYLKYLPIFLFAVVGGGLLNFSFNMVQQERLRAMLATASNIAHELRTPLLGIKSGAAGLRQYVPSLLEAYQLAKANGLPVEPIRQAHLQSMHGVLERIESEADYSNTIIDMLLMNARIDGPDSGQLAVCSMAQCVDEALRRYPFASERERQLVAWEKKEDFEFRGKELLMVHVLFNLLKNALYHIAKAGKGDILIRIERAPDGNRLVFRDAGTGIPSEVLPHIFTRFYSWSPEMGKSIGTGIGLAFCRSVMASLGGSIVCESKSGEYAEFILTFPRMSSVGESV